MVHQGEVRVTEELRQTLEVLTFSLKDVREVILVTHLNGGVPEAAVLVKTDKIHLIIITEVMEVQEVFGRLETVPVASMQEGEEERLSKVLQDLLEGSEDQAVEEIVHLEPQGVRLKQLLDRQIRAEAVADLTIPRIAEQEEAVLLL